MIGLGDRPGPDGRPLGDDARFRDQVAGFYIDAQALMLHRATAASRSSCRASRRPSTRC